VLDVVEDNDVDNGAAVVLPSVGTEPKWNFWVGGGAEKVGDNIRCSGASRGAVLMVALLLADVFLCFVWSLMGP
jgi:hypothetical protein